MFKISGFVDEVSSDLMTQIGVMKELGQKYLCPRSVNGKNIADYTVEEFTKNIKPILDENQIKFSSLGSKIGKVKIDDEEGFKKQCDQLKELVKIAKVMECKYIRIFSFFIDSDKTQFTGSTSDDSSYDEYFDKVMEKLNVFLDIVKGEDVVLIHENEKGIYGNSAERMLKLIKAIDNPQFRLAHDSSNYIQCGYDPFEAYELTKEYVDYVHLKDNRSGREVPLGIGDGKYKEILDDLNKRGYDGFVTLEPHTVFYAKLKRLFYVLPFLSFVFPNSLKVYRYVDKTMGIKALQGVSRKEVYVWQHQGAVKILTEVGAKYE